MKRILLLFIVPVLFVQAACPGVRAEGKDELLYKICFPKDETADKKIEECRDEDCGLKDEEKQKPDPVVEKSQTFTPLGASDYGMIWGANTYRVIGDDRVRALLYVIPTQTVKTTTYDAGEALVPDSVILTAFFSSYGEYQGSSVSVFYSVEKRTGQRKEISGGDPVLQMVDLHCSARKVKIYDNQTIYYRIAKPGPRQSVCFELLWEKPRVPLRWQPVSSMMVDILASFYCKSLNAEKSNQAKPGER